MRYGVTLSQHAVSTFIACEFQTVENKSVRINFGQLGENGLAK